MSLYVAKELIDELLRKKEKKRNLQDLRTLYDILLEYKWPTDWGLGSYMIGCVGAIYRELGKRYVDGGYVYSKLGTLKRDVDRITIGDLRELEEFRTSEYIEDMKEFRKLNRILYDITSRYDFGPYIARKEVMIKILDTQRDIVSFILGEMSRAMLEVSISELKEVLDEWFEKRKSVFEVF